MKPDIAHVLQAELTRRCQINSRYSLRAFARTLGLSPANLSLVLNRKRPASRRTIERVLTRLELGTQEREIVSGQPVTLDFEENFDLEVFETVSSWLAYGILSLVKTKNFKADHRAIAQRFGVTSHEVKSAVSALRTAGLLRGWNRTNNGLRMLPIDIAPQICYHSDNSL